MNHGKNILAAIAVVAAPRGQAAPAPPPNIVVVMVDDMGYSDLGCYGGETRTPHLDALAENGLRFRNFYNTARCSPTRAAILTGNYSHQVADDPSVPLPNLRHDNNITLAELLRGQGYRTYMAGKWHLGTSAPRVPWSRGFQHVYGFGANGASNAADYWDWTKYKLTSENNEIAPRTYSSDPYGFYQSDALADYSIDFIDHHVGKGDAAPFFLYLTPRAPHFDLCAPKATAEYAPPGGMSYIDIYSQGWDVVRQQRYDRMVAVGAIDASLALPPFGDTPNGQEYWPVPAWDSLPAERRTDLARRMAIYISMVDRVDAMAGRIVEHLRQTGLLDNTLIFFLSDNGGSAEGGVFGNSAYGRDPLTGAQLENMGQPYENDLLKLGGGWANVNNAPYRLYKQYNHEGGIRTPLVVHWPDGIQNPGRWTGQAGHVVDIMRTVVEITGAPFPAQYNGHPVLPMEGESLLPAFNGEAVSPRQLGFEHVSNRAWIDGQWKLATKHFTASDWSSFSHTLELYDLEADPVEMDNLAMAHPDKLVEMVEAWNAWALRVGVPAERQLELPRLACPAPDAIDLFLDTFNRNDLAVIDADQTGISGVLAGPGPFYHENHENSPDHIRVRNGVLQLANGTGMSEVGLVYNFTNQAIAEAGGFVVEMDVVAIGGAGDGYAGFGVGLTAQEASAAGGGAASSGRFLVPESLLADAVEGGGWTLAGNQGNFNLQAGIAPTAGDSYFNFSANPGTAAPFANRAVVKNLGIALQAGRSYKIEADLNVGRNNYPFIGEPFTAATSDKVAFGFFDPAGIDFGLASNAERLKIRDAINAVLAHADGEGGLEWVARTLPANGGADWQTWSYVLAIEEGSPLAGASPWFGLYGGHLGEDSQKSLAFDNLRISLLQEGSGPGFFAELDIDGNVQAWSGGDRLATIPVGAVSGRLTAAFALDGFAEGAEVRASLFFDGTQLDLDPANPANRSRTFAWRNGNSNHIGLGARADGLVEIDNLAIRTFPPGRTLAAGYAARYGLDGEDASPDADPDGDGRTNYQEWLIGSDPSVADADAVRAIRLLAVPVQDGVARFEIRAMENAAGSGVGYTVYASADLQEWVPAAPVETARMPDPARPGYETIAMELVPEDPGHDRLFLLVRYHAVAP